MGSHGYGIDPQQPQPRKAVARSPCSFPSAGGPCCHSASGDVQRKWLVFRLDSESVRFHAALASATPRVAELAATQTPSRDHESIHDSDMRGAEYTGSPRSAHFAPVTAHVSAGGIRQHATNRCRDRGRRVQAALKRVRIQSESAAGRRVRRRRADSTRGGRPIRPRLNGPGRQPKAPSRHLSASPG